MPSSRTFESLDAREEIAELAARLIYDEGIRDYALAKRKAVKQLGLSPRTMLPTNEAIEEALARRAAEYQDEDDAERLGRMRRAAAEVMRWLEPWSTYLVGHVLEGTAGPLSVVDIDLYAESAKEVEIFLLNHPWLHFDVHTPRAGGAKEPETVFEFDWHGVPVSLRIWPLSSERNLKRSEHRARLPAVLALLEPPASLSPAEPAR